MITHITECSSCKGPYGFVWGRKAWGQEAVQHELVIKFFSEMPEKDEEMEAATVTLQRVISIRTALPRHSNWPKSELGKRARKKPLAYS